MYPKQIILEEQGLRDGLQVESKIVPIEKKVEYVNRLVEAGVKRIQVASFVHPKLVPQMADAEALCGQLKPKEDVIYSGLVLNMKGLNRAVIAGLSHVAVSISASDTHSQKNARQTLSEARANFKEMLRSGKEAHLTIRGGIQCAFGCRYEGVVLQNHVLDMIKEQLDTGVDELSLADSTGMGNPRSMGTLLQKALELTGDVPLILHLHDTEGKGMANLLTALQCGVRHFDTAFGGLGGCPFITGASGNIATEDVIHMSEQMGIDTGIDLQKIAAISQELSDFLEKPLPAKMLNVLGKPDLQVI